MGTRADLYVGRGEQAEWLGSITWDGYPDGIATAVFEATTENAYREAVAAFFAERNDVTLPTEFWPWPWETSVLTDYAYAFDGGTVYASSFGNPWFRVDPKAECYGETEEYGDVGKEVFPNMAARQGSHDEIMSRSGMIGISFPPK